jgi:peptide/nickel transport system substrate-binding protein
LNKVAISKVQGIIVVAVLLVAVLGAVYFYSMNRPSSTTTGTSTAQLPGTLAVEEELQPDSLDPAVSYQTSGWETIDQVYQGLVAPNGQSYTTYVGVHAQNWTVSPDGMTYTFNLRPGVKFSNGDPFNAYVMWFSIYRTLIMNQAPAWFLGQNLAPGNGMTFNITDKILNSINYANPSPTDLRYMTHANQSVQAVQPNQLVFNLGYGTNGMAPYFAFLATLTTPEAMAVDPAVIEANSGVVAGQTNNYMTTNALGTGFYQLQSWVQGQSVTINRNPNYWGANVPASQSNYAIQPAVLDTINFYYKPVSTMIADLKSGFAQIIDSNSLGSQYSVLNQIPGVTVSVLPPVFGSSQNVFLVYMDPYAFAPFQDRRVRQAIANAIDYKSIIHTVFNDLATQWIGPVPPGFPGYNESIAGLTPYSFDPAKAANLLAQAGYKSTLPDGTVLNAAGKPFPSVNFLYNADSSTETQVAQIISSELHTIGVDIVLSPLTFRQNQNILTSSSGVNSTQYPFGINFYSEDYTASIDYVSAIVNTGQIGFSGYSNATVRNWATAAATAPDQNTVNQNLSQVTRAMYYDYTNVWLYVPYFIAVNSSHIAGMIPNPAGSGAGYFMFYNNIHYTS